MEVTVRYADETFNTSDVKNPLFPLAEEIEIQSGTKVEFSCNISNCTWNIESTNSNTITENQLTIETIKKANEGTYSLMRKTTRGQTYLTAQVYISVISSEATTSSSSITIIVFAIIPIITLVCLIVVIILIIICIWKRRTLSPFPNQKLKTVNDTPIKQKSPSNDSIKQPSSTQDPNSQAYYELKGITQSIPTKEGFLGYVNLSEIPPKEYIELQTDPNPQYMTIDESSIQPLDSEYQQKQRVYQNLANVPSNTAPYEEIPDTDNAASKLYERYVPMSSVKEEKKFVPRFISIKQFPATYRQYVASGIDKDSLFSVEFTSLNEESKINVDTPTAEALDSINTNKNPFKNIVPFDENRVVLDSQYFDCNYINASYIYECQFIATMHPTKATHRDFLQMIYQTEASMVIMLTTRKEKAKIVGGVSNRVCYWPKKDEIIECEPFVARLINSTETTAFVKQEISLKNTLDGKEHTFTQCISPIWNEDSTVAEMSLIVSLLNRLLKQLQDDSSKSIIIHCEDGISKTGIILAGITSVKELTLKKTIDIFNTVKNFRRQRMKMVPTLVSS